MLTLAYPWLLVLLALPLFIHWIAPPHRESRRGLLVPFLDRLARHTGQTPAPGAAIFHGGWVRMLAIAVSWTSIVVALAATNRVPDAYGWYAVIAAGLIVFLHRGNITRLRAGTEPKLGQSSPGKPKPRPESGRP